METADSNRVDHRYLIVYATNCFLKEKQTNK